MNVKDYLIKINTWFNWTPVAVSKPVEVYQSYFDRGRVLLGYEVQIDYKYHKPRRVFFMHDEEKLCLVSREKALKNATRFYEQMNKKIQEKQR